jgi:site-specific DNA recombinase
LQSIVDQVTIRAAHLRLAQTLSAFLVRARTAAETLDIQDRQRITWLLVKEVLIGDDAITIRHSLPIPAGPTDSSTPAPPEGGPTSGTAGTARYLLRSGSAFTAAGKRQSSRRLRPLGPIGGEIAAQGEGRTLH